jgi:Domain of unknown function (DUF4190)
MKRCPRCNQEFTEDWLTFCTSDGTPLTEASSTEDPPPTMTMPRPPVTVPQEERPTMRMPSEGVYGGPLTAPQQQQPVAPVWQPPPAPFAMATQPQQTLAVTSLILGMCSMTLGWCCGPIGLLTGPSAIGTGIFALVQIKNNPNQYAGKPLAIIGIATGGLFLLLWVLAIVIWGIGAALGGLH